MGLVIEKQRTNPAPFIHGKFVLCSLVRHLFAEHGINISGQSLMTKGDVGYLVMDVDATASAEALDTLHNLEGTIRSRVLF